MKTFNVAFLGAGRMGQSHLRNLVGIAGVHVRVVADTSPQNAQAGAAIVHADRATTDIAGAINANDVDVVMIATPTPTHAELIESAVRAGKPVWCEKPVASTLADTQRVVDLVESRGVPVMIGFMRRFDPGYAAAKRAIAAGELGRVERFRALSCDFNPPPMSFIKTSGGIFVDMMVHDFDMARFLIGEIEQVSAWGGALVDAAFADAGDVDTCVAMLRFANGALGTIEGTRRTTWGYDIRTEVAGGLAKVVVEAPQKTPLQTSRNLTLNSDHFESFPDRFHAAYQNEMSYFFDCLRNGTRPAPTPRDGLESLRVALAATQSLKEGRPINVADVK